MKRWYVLQIYAGYEDQVQADLERRIQDEGFQEQIGKVLVNYQTEELNCY